MIQAKCACGKVYQVSGHLAGKVGRCKSCGGRFAILVPGAKADPFAFSDADLLDRLASHSAPPAGLIVVSDETQALIDAIPPSKPKNLNWLVVTLAVLGPVVIVAGFVLYLAAQGRRERFEADLLLKKAEADRLPPPNPIAAKPEPELAPTFDRLDRERTYRWIAAEATAFRMVYLPAKEAIENNPLNDDLLKKFIEFDLPQYKSKFTRLIGERVGWTVKVHSIDREGVCVEADELIFTEAYTGRELDRMHVNLFIENEKINTNNFAERRTLNIGKQISLRYAKKLKRNDIILLRGRISRVVFLYGDKEPPGWLEITLNDVTATEDRN